MHCVKCGSQELVGARFCRKCGAPFPTAAAPDLRYAGFWRRFLAALIDLLIVWPAWLVISGLYEFAAATALERTVFAPDGAALSRMLTLVSTGRAMLPVVLIFGYFALMEGSSVGGSLGKLIVRLRVTKADGSRAGIARATLRTAIKPLSALPLMFGYLMAGFTGRKQALHDLMSGSLVVRR